jgi:hypothetical protein
VNKSTKTEDSVDHLRKFGQHFTSQEIFQNFLLPKIKNRLYDYCWADCFAGEGNLILPLLNEIPQSKRLGFFQDHIFLCDVQQMWVDKCISNADAYGIPEKIAKKNIFLHDSLLEHPFSIKLESKAKLPLIHITNPPYLYLGYIVKHKETQKYLPLFEADNRGYQDLYQIALMNDLRQGLQEMLYIIPANFLFGASVSNKFRDDFLSQYSIQDATIFEQRMFTHTGTNVIIAHFLRKKRPNSEPIIFQGQKIGKGTTTRTYRLDPKTHYKGGDGFIQFVENNRARNPLKYHYYLMQKDIQDHPGATPIVVIDANDFKNSRYSQRTIITDEKFAAYVKSNILWVRTVDTGSTDGRAGLFDIRASFDADGILVTKATYRTNPIQIFFETPLTIPQQKLLMSYFNLMLENLRKEFDSEFMTTYKWSESEYTRKYFGLSQVRRLIETFPILDIDERKGNDLAQCVQHRDVQAVQDILHQVKSSKK